MDTPETPEMNEQPNDGFDLTELDFPELDNPKAKKRKQTEDAASATQAANTTRFAQVLLAISLLVSPVFIYQAIQTGAWQVFVVTAATLFLLPLSVLAIRFSRRGRSKLAAWLVWYMFMQQVVVVGMMIANLGAVLLIAGILLTATLAVTAMPRRHRLVAIVLGTLVSFVTWLFGIGAGAIQFSSAVMEASVPVITISLLVLYALFGSRALLLWLNNQRIGTKLAFSFGALVGLSLILGAVAFVTAQAESSSLEELLGAGFEFDTLATIEETILILVTTEKEYLLQYPTLGLDAAYQQFGVANLAAQQRLYDQIDILIGLQDPSDPRDTEHIERLGAMKTSLDEYSESFGHLVNDSKLIGNDNEGVMGNLLVRMADFTEELIEEQEALVESGLGEVHLDDPANDLTIQLLRLMESADPEHIEAFHNDVVELRTGLAKAPFSRNKINEFTNELEAIELLFIELHDAFFHMEEEKTTVNAATEKFSEIADIIRKEEAAVRDASEVEFRGLESTAQAVEIGVLLVVVIAGVVLGVVVTRAISDPVQELTAAATRMSAGELGVQVAIATRDEIGTLAGTFNQMASQLQTTLEGLEGTVAERTRDLEERAVEMEASQRVTFAATERTTPEEFLKLLSNLIKDQFDVYHSQIYMVDDERKNAILRESTGYAGRQLLARGHSLPLDGTSLVSTAINSGKSVLVADTATDPDHLPNPLLPLTRSELVVPLKLEGQVIGVVDVQDREANRFGEQSVAVFETMAEQVAFLFENNELIEQSTRQTQEMQRFTEQLRTAAKIAYQLGTIVDPEELLNKAVVNMQRELGLYHVHIYLLDEATKELSVAAGSGRVGMVLKMRGHKIPVGHEGSIVARAARTKQPVVVEDTAKVEDHLPNPLLPNTRSELAVPLMAEDRVIGVLDVQDDQAGRFGQIEVDTLGTLAGQISTSLQTARLFTERQMEMGGGKVSSPAAPVRPVVEGPENGSGAASTANGSESGSETVEPQLSESN